MLNSRVIPVLLLKGGGLVKGERFKGHKYVGDPINAVRIFNEKEVDELVLLDISATMEAKSPDFSAIKDISSEAFMPIAYGGGVTEVSQIERLFRTGIEKVIINSAFHANSNLVKDASSIAGAQSIVISMDVRRSLFGRYEVYTHCASRKTNIDPVDYARRAQDAGAGELILTNVDHEGMAKGYDMELIRRVTTAVEIPVVAHGGAGTLQHLRQAVVEAGAAAAAAGQMFTFHGRHKAVLITYPATVDLDILFK
jgi:cyclase